MTRKWLVAALPLALLAASCSDMPTEGTRAEVPNSGLNFYVAPVGDEVVYGTEQGNGKGDLWAVNLSTGARHLMYDWRDPSGDNNSPNSVAFDAANQRMYFSVNTSNVPPFNGTEDRLYMFNVSTPATAPARVGILARSAYSADIYQGSYYYVANRTADLVKVILDPATGSMVSESTVCGNFRVNGTMPRPTSTELFFGDIAIRDGIVYGHMAVDNDSLAVKFFTIDLSDCAYQEWQQSYREQLQLAWVGNTLYGHSAVTGQFWVVNPSNGSRTAGPTYSPLVLLSDIAGTYTPPGITPDAALGIVKLTNDTDNNSATGPIVDVGSTVTWTYLVSNAGNVPIANVAVTDDQPGVTPVYVSGDANSNGLLDVGETWEFRASGIATAGQYRNVGTATGEYNGMPVPEVTDPDHYFGQAQFVGQFCPAAGPIGGIDIGAISEYLFVFTDGSSDANWQSSSKGYVGNVAINGLRARERTSGSFAYAGTIFTNNTRLNAWQSIVNNNSAQAATSANETARLAALEAELKARIVEINSLAVTPGFESRSATSLAGDYSGRPETRFVINVTSGFGISAKINITGRADQVFILRWDTDANFSNGYQGQVKFQSGGAIVPLGGLTAANFVHVAGDMNASGGGSNPGAPYPQGPRLDDGQGALISGASNFSGGGFFTGYWLTTGKPTTRDAATGLWFGETSSLSNAIFVGGWYSITTKFSMTSGTSGVHVCPNAQTLRW
jgi:uncharacterized repeat protein (TIGR01451 family)